MPKSHAGGKRKYFWNFSVTEFQLEDGRLIRAANDLKGGANKIYWISDSDDTNQGTLVVVAGRRRATALRTTKTSIEEPSSYIVGSVTSFAGSTSDLTREEANSLAREIDTHLWKAMSAKNFRTFRRQARCS